MDPLGPSQEMNCRAAGASSSCTESMTGAAWKRRGTVLPTVGTLVIDTIGAWVLAVNSWQRRVSPVVGHIIAEQKEAKGKRDTTPAIRKFNWKARVSSGLAVDY